jgi:hypothetical protein
MPRRPAGRRFAPASIRAAVVSGVSVARPTMLRIRQPKVGSEGMIFGRGFGREATPWRSAAAASSS